MKIGSASHEMAGLFARGWLWLKAMPQKFKAIIDGVAHKTKKIGKDDPRRIIHSLKVGLALTLVSLLYYLKPLYDDFGVSGMWAVLTVVFVLEFTVGATLGKGLNRVLATLLAGALGVSARYLASLSGEIGDPIILGICVFFVAAASTFSRFSPDIKKRYDYGVVIFILTFSLVSVSGYRVEKILELAKQRISTIFLGSFTCVIITMFICPVWAGEDLHNLVALNMEKLANFLEGFGEEYFKIGQPREVLKNEKSFLHGYKSILNSAATEESLANSAKWEPGHGYFRFHHPWKQYLQIGKLTRRCAYLVDALNHCINSEIQATPEFRKKIEVPCTKMSLETGKALNELASSIKEMMQPVSADPHVVSSQNAASHLKTMPETALLENSDLLAIIPATAVASLLVEIVVCTEKIAESVHELANLAHFKRVNPTGTPEKPQSLHGAAVKPLPDTDVPHVLITVNT